MRVNGCCIVRRRSRPCNAADSPFSLSLSLSLYLFLPPSLSLSVNLYLSVSFFFSISFSVVTTGLVSSCATFSPYMAIVDIRVHEMTSRSGFRVKNPIRIQLSIRNSLSSIKERRIDSSVEYSQFLTSLLAKKSRLEFASNCSAKILRT